MSEFVYLTMIRKGRLILNTNILSTSYSKRQEILDLQFVVWPFWYHAYTMFVVMLYFNPERWIQIINKDEESQFLLPHFYIPPNEFVQINAILRHAMRKKSRQRPS